MKKENYNKYGEYVGKIPLTRKRIKRELVMKAWGGVIICLLVALVSSLLLLLLPFALKEYGKISEISDQMLKYQLVGQKLYFGTVILVTGAVPLILIGTAVWSTVRAFKASRGGFEVVVDDVNYIDSVCTRKMADRHSHEYLVIYFYKYGRCDTDYLFNSDFTHPKEQFYLVVTKEDEPKILSFYRCSKFEYQGETEK